MQFNESEIEELKDILYDWLSEGFVSTLNDTQKSIFEKLEVKY